MLKFQLNEYFVYVFTKDTTYFFSYLLNYFEPNFVNFSTKGDATVNFISVNIFLYAIIDNVPSEDSHATIYYNIVMINRPEMELLYLEKYLYDVQQQFNIYNKHYLDLFAFNNESLYVYFKLADKVVVYFTLIKLLKILFFKFWILLRINIANMILFSIYLFFFSAIYWIINYYYFYLFLFYSFNLFLNASLSLKYIGFRLNRRWKLWFRFFYGFKTTRKYINKVINVDKIFYFGNRFFSWKIDYKFLVKHFKLFVVFFYFSSIFLKFLRKYITILVNGFFFFIYFCLNLFVKILNLFSIRLWLFGRNEKEVIRKFLKYRYIKRYKLNIDDLRTGKYAYKFNHQRVYNRKIFDDYFWQEANIKHKLDLDNNFRQFVFKIKASLSHLFFKFKIKNTNKNTFNKKNFMFNIAIANRRVNLHYVKNQLIFIYFFLISFNFYLFFFFYYIYELIYIIFFRNYLLKIYFFYYIILLKKYLKLKLNFDAILFVYKKYHKKYYKKIDYYKNFFSYYLKLIYLFFFRKIFYIIINYVFSYKFLIIFSFLFIFDINNVFFYFEKIIFINIKLILSDTNLICMESIYFFYYKLDYVYIFQFFNGYYFSILDNYLLGHQLFFQYIYENCLLNIRWYTKLYMYMFDDFWTFHIFKFRPKHLKWKWLERSYRKYAFYLMWYKFIAYKTQFTAKSFYFFYLLYYYFYLKWSFINLIFFCYNIYGLGSMLIFTLYYINLIWNLLTLIAFSLGFIIFYIFSIGMGGVFFLLKIISLVFININNIVIYLYSKIQYIIKYILLLLVNKVYMFIYYKLISTLDIFNIFFEKLYSHFNKYWFFFDKWNSNKFEFLLKKKYYRPKKYVEFYRKLIRANKAYFFDERMWIYFSLMSKDYLYYRALGINFVWNLNMFLFIIVNYCYYYILIFIIGTFFIYEFREIVKDKKLSPPDFGYSWQQLNSKNFDKLTNIDHTILTDLQMDQWTVNLDKKEWYFIEEKERQLRVDEKQLIKDRLLKKVARSRNLKMAGEILYLYHYIEERYKAYNDKIRELFRIFIRGARNRYLYLLDENFWIPYRMYKFLYRMQWLKNHELMLEEKKFDWFSDYLWIYYIFTKAKKNVFFLSNFHFNMQFEIYKILHSKNKLDWYQLFHKTEDFTRFMTSFGYKTSKESTHLKNIGVAYSKVQFLDEAEYKIDWTSYWRETSFIRVKNIYIEDLYYEKKKNPEKKNHEKEDWISKLGKLDNEMFNEYFSFALPSFNKEYLIFKPNAESDKMIPAFGRTVNWNRVFKKTNKFNYNWHYRRARGGLTEFFFNENHNVEINEDDTGNIINKEPSLYIWIIIILFYFLFIFCFYWRVIKNKQKSIVKVLKSFYFFFFFLIKLLYLNQYIIIVYNLIYLPRYKEKKYYMHHSLHSKRLNLQEWRWKKKHWVFDYNTPNVKNLRFLYKGVMSYEEFVLYWFMIYVYFFDELRFNILNFMFKYIYLDILFVNIIVYILLLSAVIIVNDLYNKKKK